MWNLNNEEIHRKGGQVFAVTGKSKVQSGYAHFGVVGRDHQEYMVAFGCSKRSGWEGGIRSDWGGAVLFYPASSSESLKTFDISKVALGQGCTA